MLTILWWFIKIVAIIAIVLWFADNPGSIAIEWLGWSIEGPIGLFVLVVAIISLALFVLQSFYWRLRQVPMRLREWRAAREHRRAVDTLSHALVALASDEGEAALQQSTQAIKALDHDAFARLVHAQALDAAGSYREAEQMYKALCEQEATRFLGLKGLALMNKRQANTDKAIEYLEQALILRPGSLWASEELLSFGRQGLLEFKRYTSLLQTAEKLELIDH
ncbi:MAG: heme biosynthesis HemY N-terminal domain-containing protein, partial [Pseudomonadota bacterium]